MFFPDQRYPKRDPTSTPDVINKVNKDPCQAVVKYYRNIDLLAFDVKSADRYQEFHIVHHS
jgi:hypothetical protein